VAVAAAQQWDVGVSGNSGSAQRDGGSAVAAAQWLRQWGQQRGSKTALGGGMAVGELGGWGKRNKIIRLL